MKMVTGIGAVQSHMPNGASSQVSLKEAVKTDRRSNKPIMEKRRRARINNCLNELKTLILDATKKDPARHSKLEKADILEKTVKYLQDLQRQQAVMTQATNPKIVNKFKAGFTECANEVNRFPGIDTVVKRRLLQHLNNCINGGVKSNLHNSSITSESPVPSMQVHMLPSPPSSPEQDQQIFNHHLSSQGSHFQANGYYLSNGLQVIPSKMKNGNIALVVPQTIPQGAQIPMLVPIPSRTSSTSSAASIPCSNYERISRETNSGSPISTAYAASSPTNSFEAMDCQPSVIRHSSSQNPSHLLQIYHVSPSYSPIPAPLSLVMKKERDDDQPWRPW